MARTTLYAGTSLTSTTFTPADNSLLIIMASAIDDDGGSGFTGSSLSAAGGSLSYTSKAVSTSSPSWAYGARIWIAPVTTGTSMAVAVTSALGGVQSGRLVVLQETAAAATQDGATVFTPVSPTASGSQSATLGATPLSTSYIVAVCAGDVSSGTVNIDGGGAGYTAILNSPDPGWARSQFQVRDPGSTSTTVSWSNVANGGDVTGASVVMLAFEVKLSASDVLMSQVCM